jgi:hypothetical protein
MSIRDRPTAPRSPWQNGHLKGRSVRYGGNVLTTLSCSASGIFAICCDLMRPTIARLARTFQSTRTRRRREQYIPLVAFCRRHSLADFICMCEFDSDRHRPFFGPIRHAYARSVAGRSG